MSRDVIGSEDFGYIGQAIVGAPDIVGAGAIQAKNLPQSMVGVPVTALTTAKSVVQVNIQRALRPDRLVIDRVQGATIDVYDVKIGTISLNASINPVPGDAFAPDAIGTSIRCVAVAIPAVGIQLTVAGSTGTPTLRAGFFGPSMDS